MATLGALAAALVLAGARRRMVAPLAATLGALAAALVLAGAASAHAYLVKTAPAASGILDSPPATVALTFDEAVEPRFAIVSVTDASGAQKATGAVRRSSANPDTLDGPARSAAGRGVVPRLLAGDLDRRAPGAGCVHVRRRPESRTGPAVPGARTCRRPRRRLSC